MNNVPLSTSAFQGAILGIGIVIGLIVYVLFVIAWWKLFVKAGEKGWKAIIPFYNAYIQFKLTWRPLFFWITLVVAIVSSLLSNFMTNFPSGVQGFLSIIGFALSIVSLVLYVISMHRLSKSYGHGGGYTVGLVFLNFIFMLVLGFGKSKYQGNVYLQNK